MLMSTRIELAGVTVKYLDVLRKLGLGGAVSRYSIRQQTLSSTRSKCSGIKASSRTS